MAYRKLNIEQATMCMVSDKTAKEFIDHRCNLKKPLTQGAFDRAMINASICQKFNMTSDEAVLFVIDKGWIGITVNYVGNELKRQQNETSQGFSQQSQTRSIRADDQYREIDSRSRREH